MRELCNLYVHFSFSLFLFHSFFAKCNNNFKKVKWRKAEENFLNTWLIAHSICFSFPQKIATMLFNPQAKINEHRCVVYRAPDNFNVASFFSRSGNFISYRDTFPLGRKSDLFLRWWEGVMTSKTGNVQSCRL